MHVLETSFNQNPNIGLYAFATDKYCLVGLDVPAVMAAMIEKVLKVKVHRINIAGTSLVGVFCSGNSNRLLIPGIAFEAEAKKIRETGIPFSVINTELTALGNNILANDTACLINPDFPKPVQSEIEKALNVKCKTGTIAGLNIPGSLAVISNKHGLVHRDIEDEELRFVEGLFKAKFHKTTVNRGTPYIRSGVVANSKGFIIGDLSTGIETTEADEALGFLGESLEVE